MKRLIAVLAFTVNLILITEGGIPEPGLILYGVIKSNLGGANVRMTAGTLRWTITPSTGTPVVLQTTLTNINDQFSYMIKVPFESQIQGFALSSNVLQLTPFPMSYNRAQVLVEGIGAGICPPAGTNFWFSQQDRGSIERVDLQINAPFQDSDGDGLPDYWEEEYFDNFSAARDEDSDHDGLKNWQEYLAGTNPQDAFSRFSLDVQKNPDGSMTLHWQSEDGRYYRISRSPHLLSEFAPLVTGIRATPPVNTFTDTNTLDATTYFYRVNVE